MTALRTDDTDDTRLLWVGTYPRDDSAPGAGEGVWSVALDVATGRFGTARQVVESPSPSFLALAPDERTLYAVTETDAGAVTAFRVSSPGARDAEAAGLEPLATVSTRGEFPCHVVAAPGRLWVANYGSGSFVTVPLAADGAFDGGGAAVVDVHDGAGTGPVTDRQEGPHAHYSVAAPDGAAWVVDLGADRVRRYVPTDDGARMAAAGAAVEVPPGTGPRHLVVAPDGTPGEGYAFVVGELDNQVHVLRLAPGAEGRVAGTPVASVPACVTPGPEGVGAFPSHVALSPDGSRLYLTVRGPDVVAVFAVERAGDGAAPVVMLRHLADSPLSAAWPRHFAVLAAADGDVLVVAGQSSSTLEALRVHPGTGRAEPFDALALPRPACVVERRILEA